MHAHTQHAARIQKRRCSVLSVVPVAMLVLLLTRSRVLREYQNAHSLPRSQRKPNAGSGRKMGSIGVQVCVKQMVEGCMRLRNVR
jgi:hypothetical protein